ncbi:MAG: amidohydrolase [Synergistaceae bacterium]|nr:amidohydrolase [Synergistaceae bacterium]
MNQTGKAAKGLQPRLVRWRRDLHRLAEVGLELPRTKTYIGEALKELGLEARPLGPGLAADLKSPKPGPTLLLRTDMDALPIREETGLPFAADGGAMHACGHDGHMAMLLGAAALLAEDPDSWNGAVRFLFQPGEEIAKGAAALIAAGALDGVDAVCGLHIGRLFDELATGQIGTFSGTAMASMDRFTVTFCGRGTHGAAPHKGIDPIVMAGQYIVAVQTLVSREIPASHSAVVSLGRIEGGQAFNIIPHEVHLEGTFRALTVDDRELLGRRVQDLARGVAALSGGEAIVFWDKGAPPVVNDPTFTEAFRQSALRVLPAKDLVTLTQPTMVGEDMALYLQERPGTFFFLGGGPGEPHHHPRFDFDEGVLWRGSALLAQMALDFCDW